MKSLFKLISILLLFSSCYENKPKHGTINNQVIEEELVDNDNDTTAQSLEGKTENEDSYSNVLITNTPCIELQEFAVEIEHLRWIPDPNRLDKVGIYQELIRADLKYFNSSPFYPINFENSQLNKAYSPGVHESLFDSLDFELFKEVNNIWGYFYRDQEASDWISDGVIEQWEFDTEQKALKALNAIRNPGFIIYFNTNPYFCRIRNKLIIFQTRAMAFSYDQKPLFEKFVKEKVPNG